MQRRPRWTHFATAILFAALATSVACGDGEAGKASAPPGARADAAITVYDTASAVDAAPSLAVDGAAACRAAVAVDAPGAAVAKVVIISVDGLRPDAITAAPAPRLAAMMKDGASTMVARTVSVTYTLPGHASMITGVTPEVHGIDWNVSMPDFFMANPSVLSLAAKAGMRATLVAGKDKLRQLLPLDTASFVLVDDTDDAVVTAALVQVNCGFDLLMVHLPNVDYGGHASGWMSETYLEEVRNADAAVARLLDALPDGTTIILTADHGGAGFNHYAFIGREAAPEDAIIPWIITGPGVRAGIEIEAAVSVMDTAATVAHLMGLALPADVAGRSVAEAFEP